MRKGFILVEVLVALLLGSLMIGVLFQSLSQTNQLFAKVVSTSSIQRTALLVQQQFETDFSGMIAPQLVEREEAPERDTQKKSDEDKKNKSLEDKKSDDKKSEEKKEEPFKSFIFETGEKGTVKIISFVSSNPLLTYKQPLPRAIRVAYRVVADPENQGALLLIRQQSEELFLARFEAACKKDTIKSGQNLIRSYELARNIQTITFEFFVEKIEKPDKALEKKPGQEQQAEKKDKNKDTSAEQKKRVFVLIDDWLKLSDEEKKKYEPQALPAFGHCVMTLLDEKAKAKTFDFWFAPCYDMQPIDIKGVTDLPSLQEEQGRQAAAEQEKHMFMPGGIPQQQGAR